MLALSNHYDEFTLLALDPGLNNTGVAIFRIRRSPVEILSISAMTLKADKLVDSSGLDDEEYSEQIHKRYSMGAGLAELLEIHMPDQVASESPFFDRRKPGSFKILAEVLTTLFDTVVRYNKLAKFSTVEPLLVKKVLGVAGQKGKEVVREAMEKETKLLAVLQQPLERLDEHAIDAIGVGYTWLVKKSGLLEGSQ